MKCSWCGLPTTKTVLLREYFYFQTISLNCGTLQGLYAICSLSSLLLKSCSKLLKKVKYLDLS